MTVPCDEAIEAVGEFLWAYDEYHGDEPPAIPFRLAQAILNVMAIDASGDSTGNVDTDEAMAIVAQFQANTKDIPLLHDTPTLADFNTEWVKRLVAQFDGSSSTAASLFMLRDWYEDVAWEDEIELDCGVVVYSLNARTQRLMDLVAAHGYPNAYAERLDKLDQELGAILTEWQAQDK